MEISEMISMEKIKPTSPTPHHLRIYNISLIDQMIPCMYAPVVLYFSGGGGDGSIQLLKRSLSQTLATFYPFAGVIRDALSADCNDQGLPFYVAKVKVLMRDFLQNPNVELINKFLPGEYNPEKPVGPGDNTMLIQLNCFDCGGIAMSVIFAHVIADLTSISTFLRCWADNARGLGFAPLNCILQSSFPQKPSLPKTLIPCNNLAKFLSGGRFVTKRYVFDTSALSVFKAELSSSTGTTVSRVNVVTAVIWKCFMAAVAAEEASANTNFLITQSVNLRRRAAPPLPEDSFGNFVWVAATVCSKAEEKELRELVWEVKKGTSRIDGEFVRRLEGDDHDVYECLEEWRNEIPQTEAGSMIFDNFVTLMDRRGGDGVEAWLILDQKYVAAFEKNYWIRKYAHVDPSVI